MRIRFPVSSGPAESSVPFVFMKNTPCLFVAKNSPAFSPSCFRRFRVSAATADLREAVKARVDAEYPALETIYKNLHAHPE